MTKTYIKKDASSTAYYKNENYTSLHREDGPALEYKDGNKYWYINGQLHRKDGPAVEYYDGTKIWYLNNKFHREDGPAKIITNGNKEWWINGNLHREDGPAIESYGGAKYYYLNGKNYSEANFKKEILSLKPKQKTFSKKDSYGNTSYYKDEACTILHREDGPAIEYTDGAKSWYVNGERHREDGPAIEYTDGAKSWYVNGKRHREDGPAIEYANGTKFWYLNGKEYSEQEFKIENEKAKMPIITKVKENLYCKVDTETNAKYFYKDKYGKILHNEEAPAVQYDNGRIEHWLHGKIFDSESKKNNQLLQDYAGKRVWSEEDGAYKQIRSDHAGGISICYFDSDNIHSSKYSRKNNLPAFENKYWKEYFLDGKRHRTDGPALINVNSSGKIVREEYYLNDKQYSKQDFLTEVTKSAVAEKFLNKKDEDKTDFTLIEKQKEEKNKSQVVDDVVVNATNDATNQKKEEDKMAKEEVKSTSKVMDMAKASMKEGAKRNGVRTVVKGGMVGLEKALQASGATGEASDAMRAFIASPYGEIMVKTLIGYGVPHVPQLKDHKLANIVADECRNQSAEQLQSELFDKLMEHLVPAVMSSLASLQENPAMRVLLDENMKDTINSPTKEVEDELDNLIAHPKANTVR